MKSIHFAGVMQLFVLTLSCNLHESLLVALQRLRDKKEVDIAKTLCGSIKPFSKMSNYSFNLVFTMELVL